MSTSSVFLSGRRCSLWSMASTTAAIVAAGLLPGAAHAGPGTEPQAGDTPARPAPAAAQAAGGAGEGEGLITTLEALLGLHAELAAGFALCADGPFLLATRLDAMEEARFEYPFRRGRAYAVIVAGEPSATDLDLTMIGQENGLTLVDELIDATPVVCFIPKADEVFTITLSMWEATRSSMAGLLVLELGGTELDAAALRSAASGLRGQMPKVGDQARLADVPEKFSVIGTVLAPKESITLQGIAARGPKGAVVAARGGATGAGSLEVSVADRRRREQGTAAALAEAAIVRFQPTQEIDEVEITLRHLAPEGDGAEAGPLIGVAAVISHR